MEKRASGEIGKTGAQPAEAGHGQSRHDFRAFVLIMCGSMAGSGDLFEHFFNPPAAQSARSAFSAGLVSCEAENVMDQGRNRSVFVEGDHTAMSHARPDAGEFLKAEGRVEMIRRNDACQRAADDYAFQLPAFQASAQIFDDFADAHAEINLVQTRIAK